MNTTSSIGVRSMFDSSFLRFSTELPTVFICYFLWRNLSLNKGENRPWRWVARIVDPR
jgi:hypothetical protein